LLVDMQILSGRIKMGLPFGKRIVIELTGSGQHREQGALLCAVGAQAILENPFHTSSVAQYDYIVNVLTALVRAVPETRLTARVLTLRLAARSFLSMVDGQ